MTQPTDKQLSRRDALKLLGAAAGASVLANLPSKWSTPQSVAGVLPAHALSSCNCSNPALTVMLVTGSAVLYLGDTQSGSWDNGHEAPFQVQYPCDDGGGCILSYWRGTSSSTLHVEPFVGGAFDVSLSNGVYWAILLDVNACTYDTGNAASEFLQTPNCSFSD